jgi:uncharacterized protein with NAD-binding domain and iron-sulfur cluster
MLAATGTFTAGRIVLLCLVVGDAIQKGWSFSSPVTGARRSGAAFTLSIPRRRLSGASVSAAEDDVDPQPPQLDDKADEESESEALRWARQQVEDLGRPAPDKRRKYVVIAAGWAGYGAAKVLCESDADVIMLDTLPDPTGATPYLSRTGKPVEAGTRGFWKDYPNINALCDELGLDANQVFTPFTNSSFYSPDGLEATAPVFTDATFGDFGQIPLLSSLSGTKIPDLPSPLGQVLATFPLFERIPLQDRASMVGLLVATVDCLAGDEGVQEKYDRMTAHELFLRFKLSRRLVEDFIKPTLLVGLFKPPEELSALVVMELLYYYALAHVDSFDVRWIKNGTVSDSLIAPLAAMLQSERQLQVLGGSRVGRVSLSTNPKDRSSSSGSVASVEYATRDGSVKTITDVDGVVMALSCRGMESVVSKSPDLARIPMFSKAASCKGIDVISTRLWLDRTIATRTPANVFSRFEALRGAGGTFFMLDQLQCDSVGQLWGNDERQGSVVACDFYNAGALMHLPDEEVVRILMKELLPSAVPAFADAQAVDSWIGRYPGTVSWFAPGTYTKRPTLNVPEVTNLKCAGDWVRMGDREHGAKGLCQERAYVSGLEAANSLLRDAGLHESECEVIPVRPDEAQFRAAVAVNRQVMRFLPRFWVR